MKISSDNPWEQDDWVLYLKYLVTERGFSAMEVIYVVEKPWKNSRDYYDWKVNESPITTGWNTVEGGDGT